MEVNLFCYFMCSIGYVIMNGMCLVRLNSGSFVFKTGSGCPGWCPTQSPVTPTFGINGMSNLSVTTCNGTQVITMTCANNTCTGTSQSLNYTVQVTDAKNYLMTVSNNGCSATFGQ